jgi:chemotaxis protein histidine kinase CheA
LPGVVTPPALAPGVLPGGVAPPALPPGGLPGGVLAGGALVPPPDPKAAQKELKDRVAAEKTKQKAEEKAKAAVAKLVTDAENKRKALEEKEKKARAANAQKVVRMVGVPILKLTTLTNETGFSTIPRHMALEIKASLEALQKAKIAGEQYSNGAVQNFDVVALLSKEHVDRCVQHSAAVLRTGTILLTTLKKAGI